jgi:uncharacterized protein (DUF58 family)
MAGDTYKFLPSGMADRLRRMEITVRRAMSGGRQGQHRSHAFGASVEFAEYRDYVPGDAFNRIDWGVYARTDRFVVRESHEEVNLRTYVLLDVSGSMAYDHDGPMSKMDFACYLAAGMLYCMVQQGDSGGLITFDSKLRQVFEPASTAVGMKPLLEHLETITPEASGDIETALHEVADIIKGRALVVIISDLLQDPIKMMRGVHHLHHTGKEITLFHVLDPAELTLPHGGLTEITHMETGERMTVDLDEVRTGYLRQVRTYLDEVRTACTNLQAAYILADTSMDAIEVLRMRSSQQ